MSSTDSISATSNASQFQFLQQILRQRGSHACVDTVSASNSNTSNKADQSKFLDKFTKDFGSDAAKSITNEDGSVNFDKMKEFFDKKLSSLKKSNDSSNDGGDFNPMMAMMMGGAGGSQGVGSGDMPKEIQDKILNDITDKFGSETAQSLTNDDGTLNKDKFHNFMKEHMSEMVGTGSIGDSQETSDFDPLKAIMDAMDAAEKSSSTKQKKHTHHLNKDESSKVLEKFIKDFGGDAAESITNEDGSVDGEKLMSYLKDKLGSADSSESADSNAGLEFTNLLQQNYKSVSRNDNQSIFDILFGNDKGHSNKTGNLVDATA
ncbi:MAG: hypothetical protein EB059_09055 [Alphaproteobacteria bacterium]|nr:hypothetical protein [Alphaproteobacteria bacterium]